MPNPKLNTGDLDMFLESLGTYATTEEKRK